MASYWQENFPLIKVLIKSYIELDLKSVFVQDVFDGRTMKLNENMDACDKSVTEVCFNILTAIFIGIHFQVFADKIYPLKEFRTIKENFLVKVTYKY